VAPWSPGPRNHSPRTAVGYRPSWRTSPNSSAAMSRRTSTVSPSPTGRESSKASRRRTMVSTSELGMWNLVLFDLPVATKLQRREAQRFRKLLIDLGWSREQYSVYVRYVPTGMSIAPELLEISRRLPRQGVVQVVAVTDRQWS